MESATKLKIAKKQVSSVENVLHTQKLHNKLNMDEIDEGKASEASSEACVIDFMCLRY